jgi:hypothetical protein
MKITKKFLKKHNACEEGYKWFCEQNETNLFKLINKLVDEGHYKWASWLIFTILR